MVVFRLKIEEFRFFLHTNVRILEPQATMAAWESSYYFSPTTSSSSMLLVLLFFVCSPSHAQQLYTGNAILNCYDDGNSSTLGYTCNGAQPTCDSFLLFRSQTHYQSPVQIADLLNASAQEISRLNSLPTASSAIPLGDPVLVPVTCSCASTPSSTARYYQHDAYYTFKPTDYSYLFVANNTYQGLTTCQAMISQNPAHDSRNLTLGLHLKAPLRCACPTARQVVTGYSYLLSYTVDWGDDLSTLAERFRTDQLAIWDANTVTVGRETIYPFTTLLVPLKEKPLPPSPPANAPARPTKSNARVRIKAGVGTGVSLLAFFFLVLIFCFFRGRRRQHAPDGAKGTKTSGVGTGLSDKARTLASSLTLFKFEELQRATEFFREDRRIHDSSVYRGVLDDGVIAAVKYMNGDVSNEVKILKQMNHFNLVRFHGFCVHEANTFLVFEFADKGSLRDWIPQASSPPSTEHDDLLSWKQRVQIAYDVANGMNYLHNYTNPPCIHKDLNSGNILLDRDFRAKVSNFGLARSVPLDGDATHLTKHVYGTHGYMAPEYLEHGLISPKLDVFAFGVVMLELLSGREPVVLPSEGPGGGALLSAMIEPVLAGVDYAMEKLMRFVDPRLNDEYPMDSALAMATLAKRCLAKDPADRPTFVEVFMSLLAIQSATLDWDLSSANSPGNSMVRGR